MSVDPELFVNPGDERLVRSDPRGQVSKVAEGQRRAQKVLAGFALMITLAGGAAVVGTTGYLVARAGAPGNDSRALDHQIAEARENLAAATPPPARSAGA